MNLQVTLIVIGVVVILAVYAVSRLVEWQRTQKKSMREGKPSRWKERLRPSTSPGKSRSSEIEPNFGEDDLAFVTGTDVIFGVDPDDANDRRLRPDEIENLTGPDMVDPVPVLSEAEVAGRYQTDIRGAPDHASVGGQPDSGERVEMKDMGTDDVADRVGWEDAHGSQDSGLRQGSASGSFQYPEIEGFIRVSQIDYWIKLTGEHGVGRESALAQYREEASMITKQHQIFGQKIPGRDWCVLEREAEGARFGDLIITLQLADKDGAVSEKELDRFMTLASILAKGIGYEFTQMAPIESALKQGKAIADFIRCYDSLSIIHVKPAVSEYFEGTVINRCASQLGLDQSAEGFFVRNQLVNKNKTNLYYIANMSKTGEFDFDNIKDMRIPGITFFTKPVLHRSPGVVFTEMSDTAKACAARIKGNATVPDHHTLSQSYVDRNRALIEKNAREMEEFGIASGSEEAMRLF